MKHEPFERTKERPLVWAHRGASGYAPENTLSSFQKAIDLKADGVELDVQLTKDGELVVIHDERVDRTSDGTGFVRDYTFEEIRKLNFNYGREGFPFEQIPTLREVYELLKPAGLTINVELKTGIFFYPGIEEKVAALTAECGMRDKVLYSSFNHFSCVKMHELDPECYVGFLYEDMPIGMAEYAAKYGADALHPAGYHLLQKDYMKNAAENGLDVNAWTLNEPEHIRMGIELGLNAIITNYPDRVLKICGE